MNARCYIGNVTESVVFSGMSVVGRDFYGVFPLRGKLLNVRVASHSQIIKNEEITNIKKILGLQQGKKYDVFITQIVRFHSILKCFMCV